MNSGKRREPVLLYGVALTAGGVFLTVTGVRNGDPLRLVVGIVGVLFFGLSTVALLAQKFGLLPNLQQRAVSRSRTRKARAASTFVYEAPRPELSSEAKEKLGNAVSLLAFYGVFGPEVPSVEQLEAAAADHGEPVVIDSVLSSVFSAPFYGVDFAIGRYTANLYMHSWKVEQTAEVIERQVTDLVELCNGELTVDDLEIDLSQSPLVTVSATVNSEQFESVYTGASKWVSTVLMNDLAKVYERLQLPTRLAALTPGSSLYLTLLERGAVEELEQAFSLTEDVTGQIAWIDDEAFRFEAGNQH